MDQMLRLSGSANVAEALTQTDAGLRPDWIEQKVGIPKSES